MNVLGVAEAHGGAIGEPRPRIRQHIVCGDHLRVREVVLHDMRNQLQGRLTHTMVDARLPVPQLPFVGLALVHGHAETVPLVK